jgi:hypothetical protein
MTAKGNERAKSAGQHDYLEARKREILTVIMVDGGGFLLEEEAGTALLTSVEDGAESPPAVPDGLLPSILM